MGSLQLPNDALFGLGIQQGLGPVGDYLKMAAGYEQMVSIAANIEYYPLTGMTFAPVKTQDSLPPETGGRAMPAGAFVTGVWGEGPVSLIPRLDNRFGWLLLATMGEVSTILNKKIDDIDFIGGSGAATAGVNTHIFTFENDDQYFTPWLTLHRLLPHVTAAERLGEVFQDGKVRVGTITGAAGAPVTFDLDLVARRNQTGFTFQPNPAWTAVYDDFEKFAVTSCDGHFRVEDTEFQVTTVSMTFTNQPLAPAQSLHIGSIDPIDFPALQRMVTITARILVEDYDLYVSTFKGSIVDVSTSAGEDPTCTVYQADLDVMLASQVAIGAAGDVDEPYRLRLVSNSEQNNVAWQVAPIRIQPGQPIVLQVTGEMLALEGDPEAVGYPFYLFLQNDLASYDLPSPV